jgi:hypothetical protein
LKISGGINKPRLSKIMKIRENPQTKSVENHFKITFL